MNPNGSLLWRVKFRFHGIEKKMALGRYPDVSLKEARQKRNEAREQLEEGVDPVAARLQAKIEAEIATRTTFRVVVDEFIEKMELEGKAAAIRSVRTGRSLTRAWGLAPKRFEGFRPTLCEQRIGCFNRLALGARAQQYRRCHSFALQKVQQLVKADRQDFESQ